MLDKDTVSKVVDYWLETADYDFDTAVGLFEIKKYSYCLFICHLCIEKMLKAAVVLEKKKHAPFSHNLVFLAEKSGIEFKESELDLFAEMNEFNIETRYPDIKVNFYKKANKKFTEKYLHFTGEIRKWLIKELKK